MKISRYELIARFYPAFIASIPFLIFYFLFLESKVGNLVGKITHVKLLSDIIINVIFLYLMSFIARSISKDILESTLFKSDETNMPTTNYLMNNNMEYSEGFKKKIFDKIINDFQINIPERLNQTNNDLEIRKSIAEAIQLMRNKLKNGRLLLNRNIEYGFIRNLIGGSVVSVLVCIVGIIFSLRWGESTSVILFIILTIIYLIPIILSRWLMQRNGRRYAKALFQEYMSINL